MTSTAISVGANLVGSALMGGGGSGGGADISGGLNQVIQASQQATDKASAEYNLVNQQNQAFLSPYITGGLTAYDAYNDALGLARPSDSVGGYLGLSNYNLANPAGAAGTGAKPLDSALHDIVNTQASTDDVSDNGMGMTRRNYASWLLKNGNDQQKLDFLNAQPGHDKLSIGHSHNEGTASNWQSLATSAQNAIDAYKPAATGPDPNNKANWTTASSQSVLDKFRNSPGYQFALNEGLNAVSRQNAAKGLTNSGAELKGLNDYAQGQADQTYQNYVNNLYNASGIGANATSAKVNSNSNTGQLVGNADLVNGQNIGNAYLTGIQGQLAQSAQQSASSNSMFSTIGNLAGNLFGGSSKPWIFGGS